ncbi:MAG: hypothetical protein ACW99F_14405 [Candidatus Hodarchaeales archaeon]
MISKTYQGIVSPKDFGDVESGIAIVIQHIYMHKMTPLQCFGKCCSNGNLLEIVFSKDSMGGFTVDTKASTITTNDCENILTGLGELLMRLHLERMAAEEIKITLKKDSSTSSIDYTPDEGLI